MRAYDEEGEAAGHGPFDTLDIGGGFPVPYRTPVPEIEAFCGPINQALEAVPPSVRMIAEPGRFIVAPAGVGVASVMGHARRQGRWWYYLDDGVYGLFSGQHYEHASYPITSLGRAGPTEPAVLAGPTCDSIDVIDDRIDLPRGGMADCCGARHGCLPRGPRRASTQFLPQAHCGRRA